MLASPSLHASIAEWEREPEGPRARATELALVRYLSRMAGRPTPFGLFAGISVGSIGKSSALRMSPRARWRRRTRLDTGVLVDALERLQDDPVVRTQLVYYPNSTLTSAMGRFRYSRSQRVGASRAYSLVLTEQTPYLVEVLDGAQEGASVDELVRRLTTNDPEVSTDDAAAYVHQLIDAQLLDARLAPPVTSDDPLSDVLHRLASVPASGELRASLTRVRDELATLDGGALAATPERYEPLTRSLEALAPDATLSQCVQVDLVQPADRMTIGEPVIEALVEALDVVHRLTASAADDPLSDFKAAFARRYENGRVPLLTVLDDEGGIGFDSTRSPVPEGNPLLGGLRVDPPERPHCVMPHAMVDVLLPEVVRAVTRKEQVLELTDALVERLSFDGPTPPPDAVGISAQLAARSPEALDAGDFQVVFDFATGPPGVRQITRFSGLLPELDEGIREHLRCEESLRPDCVFAEIVFQPHGRMGNIVSRPVLREHEIVFLAVSGAEQGGRIALSDLDVCVVEDEVILWSRRLDRRVLPCLSNSHNYDNLGHTIYRFLCLLASQRRETDVMWSWGELANLDFLPRLVYRNIVIEKATWRIDQEEIRSIAALPEADRYRALCEFREERSLPRFIAIRQSDRELPVDLDNILSADAFLEHASRDSSFYITEVFPLPDQLVVGSDEGPYVQQILVPVTLEAGEEDDGARVRKALGRVTDVTERDAFFPGSQWLYLRLFAGEATVDRLLGETLAPLTRALSAESLVDQWHFLRYGDPGWHLRVRLHSPTRSLLGDVHPRVLDALGPWLSDGGVWKLEHGTYRRELQRYGGDAGIRLAETIFTADSRAVADLAGLYAGPAGADTRWRFAILGTDMLLDDLGLDLEAKYALACRMRDYFSEEFGATSTRSRVSLGAKYRASRKDLEDLFGAPQVPSHALAPGIACFAARSRVIEGLRDELVVLERAGIVSRNELAESYVHMFINRLMPSHPRVHELVVYDFLARRYRSLQARRRTGR